MFRGDVEIATIMGNVYWDFPIHKYVDLYIGGGTGMARVSGNLRGGGTIDDITYELTSDTDWVFAWQVMVGFAMHLTDHIRMTTGYRLFSGSDPRFELGKFDMPLIHTVELGLRFTF